jgi:hypothetical protein
MLNVNKDDEIHGSREQEEYPTIRNYDNNVMMK